METTKSTLEKTVPAKSIPINLNEKKLIYKINGFFILYAFLITLTLLITVNFNFFFLKYQAKKGINYHFMAPILNLKIWTLVEYYRKLKLKKKLKLKIVCAIISMT